jgi:hypothetical protein
MSPPPEVVQFFASGIHAIIVGLLCIQHGRLVALQYDRRQLNNAYFRRSLLTDFTFWFLSSAGFISAGLTCGAYKSAAPLIVHIFQAILQAFALLLLQVDRSREQDRTISVFYMQHKYGLDSDLLWQLLSRHQLPHFPIAHFESRLHLTGEQKHAYQANDCTCTRMRELVQDRFVMPLSRSDVSTDPVLSLYREKCVSARQRIKLNKLIADFYANKWPLTVSNL